MAKIRIILIAAAAIALVLGSILAIVDANWPELIRLLHGGGA